MGSTNKNNETCSKKRKNENESEEETEEEFWSPFIVISSKNQEKPVSKISPFVVEKTIKGCAGEVKNVTKLRSGNLLIECVRKQQSLNLLALQRIGNVEINSSPHRSLNSSQGIIRYRDDDLSELTDEEICRELAPQGITKVKRFISKKDGQEVKLNTFLLTFNSPNIPKSIHIGLYNIKVSTYIPNPVRCYKCQKFGHGKGQCRGKLICFKCSEEGHEGFSCTNSPKCANCNEAHAASSKDCSLYKKEKEIQKLKVERNVTYPEARRIFSAANNSTATSYASVTKRVLRTIETQTMFTWPIGNPNPVELPSQKTDKTIIPTKYQAASSQTPSTSIQSQKHTSSPKSPTKVKKPEGRSSTKSPTKPQKPENKSSDNQKTNPGKSKEKQNNQKGGNRTPKYMRDPIQVHNKYGDLEDMDDDPYSETIWGDAMDTLPQPRRPQSRSPRCDGRKNSQRNQSFSPIRLR